MKFLSLIAIVYYIVYLLLFVYLSFCSFFGKPIFFSRYLHSWLLICFVAFNPLYIISIFNELSSIYLIILVLSLPLIITFFITKGQKDIYQFKNITISPKAIAEHAIRNLGISYESLDDSTKIIDYEDTSLLYLIPKNASINFQKIQDRALQNQIIQEIRMIMVTYKRSSIKRGLFFIFLIMVLIVSAARFVSLISM